MRSVRTTKPETSFGRNKTTRNALLQFGIFVVVVLFLYLIFGGFSDW